MGDEFDSRDRKDVRGPRFRFRCVACSYGASRSAAPERCPMCGASTWEYEKWRPFSELADDGNPLENGSMTATY
jgi:hypothetical protein